MFIAWHGITSLALRRSATAWLTYENIRSSRSFLSFTPWLQPGGGDMREKGNRLNGFLYDLGEMHRAEAAV
jgi:hypothetical protein